MQWPWMRRDAQLTAVVVEFARQTTELDLRWQARYDALLEKYHALKVQGAISTEHAPALERPSIDPVLQAITEKAGKDRKLRALMSREAMHARKMGISDDEIIQKIEQGVAVDDEGIPA